MPKFENGKGGCVKVEKTGWVEAGLIYIERDKTKLTYDPRSELPPDLGLMASLEADGWAGGCLTCRPRRDGTYEAADGRQRVSAVIEVDKRRRAAGLPGLQVLVYSRTMDDLEFLKVSATLNNVFVPENPDVSAERAKRMYDGLKMTIQEIAVYHNRSEATVRNWLDLAAMPAPARKAVREGRASVAAVKKAAQDGEEALEAVAAAPDKRAARKAVKGAVSAPKGKPLSVAQIESIIAAGEEAEDFALSLDGNPEMNMHRAAVAGYHAGLRRAAGL